MPLSGGKAYTTLGIITVQALIFEFGYDKHHTGVYIRRNPLVIVMNEETIEVIFENKNLKELHRQIREFVASVSSASIVELKTEEFLDDQKKIIGWKGTLLYQVPKRV